MLSEVENSIGYIWYAVTYCVSKHCTNCSVNLLQDGYLSGQEMVDKYDLFVGSQATDFGKALKHQELWHHQSVILSLLALHTVCFVLNWYPSSAAIIWHNIICIAQYARSTEICYRKVWCDLLSLVSACSVSVLLYTQQYYLMSFDLLKL